MFRTRTRRTVITGVALAAVGALAGCASASSSTTSGSTQTASQAGATGLLKTILADRTLTVGMSADPPFSFQNANGSFVGITPQLAQDFAAKLGVQLKVVTTTTTSMISALQTGQVDMLAISLSATPAREKAISFGDPFYEGGNSWVVEADSPYKTVSDLNNPNVTVAFNAGTFQATATTQYLPKAKTRELSNSSYSLMLAELASGTSTAISVPSLIGSTLPKKYSNLRDIPATASGVDPTAVSFGIPKNQPALTAAFNSFLAGATADGTLAKLDKQYLTVQNILG
jgi:polar amino acid transport system substrate-binding protein